MLATRSSPSCPSCVDLLRAGWCQNTLALDRRGQFLPPQWESAVAWSLVGALYAVLGNDARDDKTCDIEEKLLLAIRDSTGFDDVQLLADWNDQPQRTLEEVLAMAENIDFALYEAGY